MLIIGCGNRERGDDAVGVLVVEQLRGLGAAAESYTGEPIGLLELWTGHDDVILVDATVTGAPPGTLHAWDAAQQIPHLATCSTHGVSLAEVIELARALGRLPARLRVFGIEGRCFDLGAEVSPEVRSAAHLLAGRLAAEAGANPTSAPS